MNRDTPEVSKEEEKPAVEGEVEEKKAEEPSSDAPAEDTPVEKKEEEEEDNVSALDMEDDCAHHEAVFVTGFVRDALFRFLESDELPEIGHSGNDPRGV